MKGLNTLTPKLEISDRKGVIAQRMERSLFTDRGEVLGQPEFGSDLSLYFFEPATLDNAREVIRLVEEVVADETDIIVESITSAYTNINSSGNDFGLLIKIEFYFADDPTALEEVVFFKIKEFN